MREPTVVLHPLDPDDAVVTNEQRTMTRPMKGKQRGIDSRAPFDAFIESVQPRNDVTLEVATIGGVPGFWVRPTSSRPDEAILHLHAGWFMLGSAKAFRHLVGQIAARAGASAFIPDYRLAPEHPFPAAPEDVLACYRGLEQLGIRRLALTGDSAGANLALGLASRATAKDFATTLKIVAVAAVSPVTDLTLSGESYTTRAEADPYFTRPQVVELVQAYLRDADPRDALASPLHARLSDLPPVRIHVGDDEVLLDDSRQYIERAVAAGVDARLDVWAGMPHGFVVGVGRLKAAGQALDDIGAFINRRLRDNT